MRAGVPQGVYSDAGFFFRVGIYVCSYFSHPHVYRLSFSNGCSA